MEETPRSNRTPWTRGHPEPLQDLGQFVVDRVHQGGAVAERRQPLPGQLQRGRVAVQRDQPGRGEGGQQGLAVAAEAEGGVHHDRAGLGEGGGQQVQAAPEHHRARAAGAGRGGHGPSQIWRALVHVLPWSPPARRGVARLRRGRAAGGREREEAEPHVRAAHAGESGVLGESCSRRPLRVTLVHSSPRSTRDEARRRQRRGIRVSERVSRRTREPRVTPVGYLTSASV